MFAMVVLLSACGEVRNTPADGAADGGGDATAQIDAPPAACGDGRRDPGEACYGVPALFDGGDVTYDAQLADIDGDGDLDLLFLIGDEYKYVAQQGGQFAAANQNGPTTFATRMRAVQLAGDARLELVDAGETITTWRTSGTSTSYTSTTSAMQTGVLRAFDVASVTGAAIPNVIALYNDSIVVGTYNPTTLALSTVAERSMPQARALAVGDINGDVYMDVVGAGANGIVLYRGKSGGLEQVTDTGQDVPVDGVAIGDIDGDDVPDIAFVVKGSSGQLGVMRGLGGAAFAAPVTMSAASLGPTIQVADVDGDGRDDVIATRVKTASNAILVAHGKPDGTLADPIAIPIAVTDIDYLHAEADYNGDGAPDIVATELNTETIAVFASTP
ncbi:MAG: FG-GAP repeat domain-containing protein [Kofleriaceae bacterium]